MKVAVCVLNYNMPDMTDDLVLQLNSKIKVKHDLFVIDNGSINGKVPKSVTHPYPDNKRLTGGMNRCLSVSNGYDLVWLVTNDVWISSDNDPVESAIKVFNSDNSIGIVHPSIIKPVPDYAYPWMLTENKSNNIFCNMVDIICPFYNKKALDSNNWEFDTRFTYGWGIDYDSCYIARKSGLKVAMDYNCIVGHKTSVTYESGNSVEFKNKNEYYGKALADMYSGMNQKYGSEWKSIVI
jgi:hypothetical protein